MSSVDSSELYELNLESGIKDEVPPKFEEEKGESKSTQDHEDDVFFEELDPDMIDEGTTTKHSTTFDIIKYTMT